MQQKHLKQQLQDVNEQCQAMLQEVAAGRMSCDSRLAAALESLQSALVDLQVAAAAQKPAENFVEQELQRITEENCQFRQTLKAQEAIYRRLFDCNPQPMWVYDLETLRFLAVNEAAIAKYGYSQAEFLAMTIADIRPAEEVSRLLENIAQVDEGLDFAGLWQHRLRDGQIIQVEIVSYALEFDSRPAELVMAQDVTARIQAQEALRYSEERYRQLVELSPQLIWNADEQGRNTYVSPRACEYIGLSAEQLMNLDWRAVIHPEDVERVYHRWLMSVRTGEPYETEYRLRRADGVYCWHLVRAIRVQRGAVTQWFGMSTDIDDRKQAELTLQNLNYSLEQKVAERTAELRKSQGELQAILNNSPAKIYVEDLEGRYIFVNQTFLRVFDCQPEAILGKTTHDFFPPDIADTFRANEQLLLAQGDVQQFEEVVRVKGEERVFLSHKFLLRDDQGEVYALCGMSTDITDRKAMEEALQDSRDRLQAMFAALPDHVFRVNRAGQYLDFYASHYTPELTGLDDLVGRTITEVLPPDLAQAHLQRLEAALETQTVQVSEQLIPIDNTLQFREVRVAPCGPHEVVFVVRDITDLKAAERALRASQSFLQTVLETAPIAIFWKDRHGVYQGANAKTVEVFGLSSTTDLINHTDDQLAWSPEVIEQIRAEDRQILTTEAAYLNSIQHLVTTTGVEVWLEIDKVPLCDGEGNIIGILGTAQNVTQRKQTEIELQDLTNRLTLALQAGAYGTWDWEPGQEAIWDDRMYEIYGLQDLGRPATYQDWRDRVHPDDIGWVEAQFQVTLQGEAPFNVEFRIWRADGELRWVQAIAKGHADAQGNLMRLVGINRDITERKRSENALQESENRFRRIFSSNIIGMMFTDFSGQVFDANDRFLNLLGYTRAELETQGINWATLTPPEHQANDATAIEQLRRHGTIDPWEKEYFRKDGSRVAVLIGVALFNDADTRCVCVVVDISDRKQAELNLQLTNQELARATRLKDEFLANMSHELRTPLNAILGMTEGLQEEVFGPLTERQRRSLTTIERSGTHLLSLINDILDLSKIEAGQLELEFATVRLNVLCDSSLTFVKQQAHKKRLQLSTQIPSGLPDLYGDERRLRQVLINLLTNAVKFTPAGGRISLRAAYTPASLEAPGGTTLIHPQAKTATATQGTLTLTVADTGIGISPDNAQKLFQPFMQVDSALNRQHEGTGLGLALVKRITKLHGGEVTLSSQEGIGSQFTLQLPVIVPPVTQAPSADAAGALKAIDLPVSKTQVLILLAEDNKANVYTISAYLSAKGYRLLVASTGREAVKLALSTQPDLILMDVQMPELDGLEAMRQIRAQAELATVPIVALTALAMPEDRDRCLAAGANEYLSKPIRLKQLSHVIQTLLA